MKYLAPQGTTRLSHAGAPVSIAGDGSFDLDLAYAALLAPHGIVAVGDPAPIDPMTIPGLTIAQVTAALVARSVAIPSKATDIALRGLLRQALAKPSR